jgi:molecular chaperone Hsp33
MPVAREVHVTRYICRQDDLLVARGEFSPIFDDYLKHTRRWLGEPTGLALTMTKQGLAAAGLHLTCRPTDESTAWTLNLAEPPLNIFIASDAGAGTVVGRYFAENVSTEDHSRFYVQAVRQRGKPHLSTIPVTGFDTLKIFEQYYAQSEQTTARFFELGEDEYLMLMALPDVDDDWLKELSREAALALLSGTNVQLIETRPVVFACTCDHRRITHVVWGIFKGNAAEFFGADAEVEARCPRCGRAYSIARDDFAAAGRREKRPGPGGGRPSS